MSTMMTTTTGLRETTPDAAKPVTTHRLGGLQTPPTCERCDALAEYTVAGSDLCDQHVTARIAALHATVRNSATNPFPAQLSALMRRSNTSPRDARTVQHIVHRLLLAETILVHTKPSHVVAVDVRVTRDAGHVFLTAVRYLDEKGLALEDMPPLRLVQARHPGLTDDVATDIITARRGDTARIDARALLIWAAHVLAD